MKTLKQLAARTAAKQCHNGVYTTCVGLISLLPRCLAKEVYRHVSLSDLEVEIIINFPSYLRRFNDADWARLHERANIRQRRGSVISRHEFRSTTTLLDLAARAAAKQCRKGVYLSCIGLLRILPQALVEDVYDHMRLSDIEIDVLNNVTSYSDGLFEEEWARFQSIAYPVPE
jgi:hypothetical protein